MTWTYWDLITWAKYIVISNETKAQRSSKALGQYQKSVSGISRTQTKNSLTTKSGGVLTPLWHTISCGSLVNTMFLKAFLFLAVSMPGPLVCTWYNPTYKNKDNMPLKVGDFSG